MSEEIVRELRGRDCVYGRGNVVVNRRSRRVVAGLFVCGDGGAMAKVVL